MEWDELMVREFSYAAAVSKCKLLSFTADIAPRSGFTDPDTGMTSPLSAFLCLDFTANEGESTPLPWYNNRDAYSLGSGTSFDHSINLAPNPISNYTYFDLWPPDGTFEWQIISGNWFNAQCSWWLHTDLPRNFDGIVGVDTYLAKRARFRTSQNRSGFIAVATLVRDGDWDEFSVSSVAYESSFVVSYNNWITLAIPEAGEETPPQDGMIRFAVWDETPSEWTSRTGIGISGAP